MKWTLRYAALLLALVMVLGSVAMMRPEVATANEDVVFMDPPNDRGDPDEPGGRLMVSRWNYWFSLAKRELLTLRLSLTGSTIRSPYAPKVNARDARMRRR